MFMSNSKKAAAILTERRINGSQGDRLPIELRPKNIDEALAIQEAVTEDWCAQMDDSIGGWKCLQPPQDRVIVGPIYTSSINSVSPVSLWPKGNLARIEPEIGFVFGKDLPVRAEPYTAAEVDAAIARTHMALELINCRYADTSDCEFPEMLADCLINQGIFVGPQIDSEIAKTKGEMLIQIMVNGETKEYAGKHPNQAPRAGLYWLAEFLRQRGQGIQAGQVAITGSFAGVIEVPLNADVKIHYENLGEMTVRFLAK
jgi:2-keto-4-pentenoate hydratase